MKQTMLIAGLMLSSVAAAAIQNVTWDYFSDNKSGSQSVSNANYWYNTGCSTKNLTFSADVGVTGTYKRADNATGANFFDDTGEAWTNTSALNAMNSELGTSFTAAQLQHYACVGAGEEAKLTLTFTGADYVVGQEVIIYTTVGSRTVDLSTTTGSLVITGLGSTSYTLASHSGSGFDGTYSDGVKATTLVKITGTITADPVTLVFDGANHSGFGMVAVGMNVKSMPEPATATLSLLALAGLAARRRRK